MKSVELLAAYLLRWSQLWHCYTLSSPPACSWLASCCLGLL